MRVFQPTAANPWDERKAAHLLNRAGFGGPQTEAVQLAKLGFEKAVERFLDYEAMPDDLPAPDWAVNPPEEFLTPETVRRRFRDVPEAERREKFQEYQRQRRRAAEELKLWWLRRLCVTLRPFQEKMTLFWHGHLASSIENGMNPLWMYRQNELFRRSATGNFKQLIHDVSKDPAMLRYLDNVSNRRQHPNENYARELMELFTLGIGNYTEQDIKESARAFTGWAIRDSEPVFVRLQHDGGEKTFLGETGRFDGDDIVNIIFKQPAVATYIVRKLWTFFAYEEPEPELVDDLAAIFRETKYELKPLLRAIFTSEEFYSERAIRTQIKSPVQLAVSAVRSLHIDQPRLLQVAQMTRQMGQDLLAPPNVKGWDGGKQWINSTTLFLRYQFARFLVTEGARGEPFVALRGGPDRTKDKPSHAKDPANAEKDEPRRPFRDKGSPRPARLDPLLAGASRRKPDAIVSHLEHVLLGDKLPANHHAELVKFLNTATDGGERKFDPAAKDADAKLRALVCLVMTTPAYQLC